MAILAFLLWFYLISDFAAERDVHKIKALPNGQYSVACQTNKQTVIYFPTDEYVETYLILDDKKWDIGKLNQNEVLGSTLAKSSAKVNRLEILPKEQTGSARFMVKTNKNSYYLKCSIDPANYQPKVRFIY